MTIADRFAGCVEQLRALYVPMGQKLCARCKNRKPIKGGSQRPNSIGVLAFTCADCKAKSA